MPCPHEETRPAREGREGRICGLGGLAMLALLVFSAGFTAVVIVAPEGTTKRLAGGWTAINQRRRSLVLALDDKQKRASNWEKLLHKLTPGGGPSGDVRPEIKAKGPMKLFAIFEQGDIKIKSQRRMRGTNGVHGGNSNVSADKYASNSNSGVVLSAALVSIILALVARSSRNRRERAERVRRVLEEEEAEIVEFYKTENAFPSDNTPTERESHTLVVASGRSSSDNSLTRLHQETRDSQGDLYYSRVLSELACVEGDDEQRDLDLAASRVKEECIVTERNAESGHMTPPESHEEKRDVDGRNNALDLRIKTYDTQQDTQEFNSTKSDSTDSMSSISYDGADLDVESAPQVLRDVECQVHEDVPLISVALHSEDEQHLETRETHEALSSPRNRSRGCLVDDPSNDDVTPPRSNVCRNRRRVSFCAQVQVKEIPKAPSPCKQEISFESYLYVMLLGIAGLILLFSLLPAHPSLSPTLATVTKDEMLERAEALLNGHWEVEL